MPKYLAYVPDGELFEAKYAFLQFGTVVSDEAHLVVIDTEAEFADVQAALAKSDKDYIVVELGRDATLEGRGNRDLCAVVELLRR
ncbi:hypothetical protein [Pararhizobium sp.]|uniref:hypothetical protein n=1 Tax=Pararhizobium sp. TaxID=1977563 RepID=UPI003D14AC96